MCRNCRKRNSKRCLGSILDTTIVSACLDANGINLCPFVLVIRSGGRSRQAPYQRIEQVLRPAIFIFLYGLFSRFVHSIAVYSFQISRTPPHHSFAVYSDHPEHRLFLSMAIRTASHSIVLGHRNIRVQQPYAVYGAVRLVVYKPRVDRLVL
jgi:hypothetical protein